MSHTATEDDVGPLIDLTSEEEAKDLLLDEKQEDNEKEITTLERERRAKFADEESRLQLEAEKRKEEIRRQRDTVLFEDLTDTKVTDDFATMAVDIYKSLKLNIRRMNHQEIDMKRRIEKLQAHIEEARGIKHTVNCHNVDVYDTEASHVLSDIMVASAEKSRLVKTIVGHNKKIIALKWGLNDVWPETRKNRSTSIVTASQDGKVIVWDGKTGLIRYVIKLNSCWVMSCAYEQSKGALIAAGTMDNYINIYTLPDEPSGDCITVGREMIQHEGFVSDCCFLEEGNKLISCSADKTIMLWNLEKAECCQIFHGHDAAVLCVNTSPTDENVIISGGSDNNVKVWDLRVATSVMNFGPSTMAERAHSDDVNSTCFLPNGFSILSASDDTTVRLFDLRSYAQLNKMSTTRSLACATVVTTSKTGRISFIGYDNGECLAFDTLKRQRIIQNFGHPKAHEMHISGLGVNSTGDAFATASWDKKIKIWA